MQALKQGTDVLFILLGAILVLAMHSGFAFLELGTVRKKNQVNALVKILVDFSVSTVAYFLVGYGIAYGTGFLVGADHLVANSGYELVRFFFLLTFAAAIPAIISGGIAERARFGPQLIATAVIVGVVYPLFEGVAWNQRFGIQHGIQALTGQEFHDFAGSIVVHAVGGWIALPAVLLLGARSNRYRKDGAMSAHPPSNIPFLALGAWILTVGWFGFNVMSAQSIDKISGLVAVNSLMAMVGGTLAALALGRNDPGFVHNGPLAGLVAVCAGSDLMHPLGALVVGACAGRVTGSVAVIGGPPTSGRRRSPSCVRRSTAVRRRRRRAVGLGCGWCRPGRPAAACRRRQCPAASSRARRRRRRSRWPASWQLRCRWGCLPR